MATSTGKIRCTICSKEKSTVKCGGCHQDFCRQHSKSHEEELNQQLDEIEVKHDLFRQSLTQHNEQTDRHILIQQIDHWKQKSIKQIEQVAEEVEAIVVETTNENIRQMEKRLSNLTDQLRQSRREDDVDETSLRQFHEELDQLTKELTKLSDLSIREESSSSFINKIYVDVSGHGVTSIPNESIFESSIHQNTTWKQNGVTVAGGNGQGNGLNQLFQPVSAYVVDDQTIYVADTYNNRVVEWKTGATKGQVVAGGNGAGNQTNQLNRSVGVIIDKEKRNLIICDLGNRRVVQWPRQNGTTGQITIADIDCCKLTIDNNGYIYVSDSQKHEVRRWKVGDASGTLVAGGNGSGNGLNQLDGPNFICVDENHSVYVSDKNNHRVMKWLKDAKEGIIVAGGRGEGTGLSQLSYPQGLLVDHLGTVYVSDSHNHRIMRWCEGALQGDVVVGGNGEGKQENQLNIPMGLLFDREENLYVIDQNNNRIQRFDVD